MDSDNPVSARGTVEQFLETTVSGRMGDLADFYAPTVVIEMPFAPEVLYPARTEVTREQLRERFTAGASSRRYTRLDNVRIHQTEDPETVVVEYELEGVTVETEEPFRLKYVMVMTIRDGLIVHSRDYADPLAGARVLGRLPELLSSLAEPAR
ncbi:nuclear transport factor 2 family protein [Actinopolymorpha sp. NPDC004070]|uniref:nuclear transport factor 2 family protein n=1 Tax=Actinopolymorpha sp. NPDC004070 TaxID=3154548 RepID=UPI0033A05F15